MYGRRPVAEAQRGRRRVHRVWTGSDLPPPELTRLAGSPDHQGMVAEVDPYPYADPRALLAPPDGLLVALDQIQDPRNLGAVCRSAEAAGAAGVVIPSRRSAAVTAAACKASAGAVEHLPVARVPNLADWLGLAKEAGAWVYGARSRCCHAVRERRPDRQGRPGIGQRGGRPAPAGGGGLRLLVSIPIRGSVQSLNVSAAAAVLLFEAARQRGRRER